MNFDGYPKRSPKEKYSGMWGRIGYVFQFKDKESAIWEANDKDDIWQAAYYIKGTIKGFDMSELSDIEVDAWYMALKLATERTEKQWIQNETNPDVLRKIVEREVETGEPDMDRIKAMNTRIQELR
jgi:hypothetical protein